MSLTNYNHFNPFPNCVFMKLHSTPKPASMQLNIWQIQASRPIPQLASSIQENSLQLTLRFGEQPYHFSFRGKEYTIIFGLQRGTLRLKLSNAKMPLESIQLPDFLSSMPIEKQSEASRETEGGLEVKVTGGVTGKTRNVIKTVKKYQNTLAQIYSQGEEDEPIWQFQAASQDILLRGIIQKEPIGIIEIERKPCKIEALFEFQDDDLFITKGAGIDAESEKKTVLRWIKSQLKSRIISKVEVYYGN